MSEQKQTPPENNENQGVAAYFINNRVISWMVSLIFLIGGTAAFFNLGRLEDPAFTIKDAMVVTSYPGNSSASGRGSDLSAGKSDSAINLC